jgi:hypothetical protein
VKSIAVAVSGSRSIADKELVWGVLDDEISRLMALGYLVTVHLGDATGVDWLATEWARDRAVPRRIFFADRKKRDFWLAAAPLREWPAEMESGELVSDWDLDGRKAGAIRNLAMIAGEHGKVDQLIAIWDGVSRGTLNAQQIARASHVFIRLYTRGALVP